MATELWSTCEVPITFGDLDPMGIVWHGNYVKFMERGREAFGRKYGLDAMMIHDLGYFTPLVHLRIDHKLPLEYGDIVEVRTVFVPDPAAKVVLHYVITAKGKPGIVAVAETIQVFLDSKRRLQLLQPAFYHEWKTKHGVE